MLDAAGGATQSRFMMTPATRFTRHRVKFGTTGIYSRSACAYSRSTPPVSSEIASTKYETPVHLRAKQFGSSPRPIPTRWIFRAVLTFSLCFAAAAHADEVLFADAFKGKLGDGWSWIREDRDSWRVTPQGLEVRVQPGNMWGRGNNAKNVLVRPAPDLATGGLEISVRVTNQPTAQFEQVDLVWYYDDSHMVKLGQELVDGKLSIVMGREEADRTRTIAIVPLKSFAVELRLRVTGNRIQGQFRSPDAPEWQEAGECDLPAHGPPMVSLQCYQGSAVTPHWARITDLVIRRLPK